MGLNRKYYHSPSLDMELHCYQSQMCCGSAVLSVPHITHGISLDLSILTQLVPSRFHSSVNIHLLIKIIFTRKIIGQFILQN